MEPVPPSVNFSGEEEKTLEFWEKIHAFEESQRRNADKPPFSFYDGPPFATGLPHYGHILAGTIKDTVTRYAHQTGHSVDRRFGWDCHGLPVEFEIDKQHQIKTKDDVLKWGIGNYNEACRAIVMRYSSEWKTIVSRFGRWIDFENGYKTMDLSYMESVWWVFKQLFEKEKVYRGFKVMPYSTKCTTPLSNFESNLNYKDVRDPAVFAAFPLVSQPNVSLVAWTTTPWTLPSNLALVVHPDLDYAHVKTTEGEKEYIMLESRLHTLFPQTKKKKKSKEVTPPAYTLVRKLKGKELANERYVPLFEFFKASHEAPAGENRGAFRVLCDTYVTEDSGTGVVHSAPGFGEDDLRVCIEWDVVEKGPNLPCPVDDDGKFTDAVPDFKGLYVKDADKEICIYLKKAGRIIKQDQVTHSYPFCWRSDTPLIYKAVPSWFINVESVRDKLVEMNKRSTWVPSAVQEKRFHNWIDNARDWAVSRNRYWGTPLPLWVSEDFSEVVCVGSVAELEKLSGEKNITDIHRHKIDHITIPSSKGNGVLRRVDEVFDCWFESGSMPYAQQHYPFENEEKFKSTFPADFIAEGLDQTRGWFYTLLVLSTCVMDSEPFKNVIVNGLVLAEDGSKMSKSKQNFEPPMDVCKKYGADAVRMYLINSPVVRGEPLKFEEDGVLGVVKELMLKWFNSYRFTVTQIRRYDAKGDAKFTPSQKVLSKTTNEMDRWLLGLTNDVLRFVVEEMKGYRLYTVIPRLVDFVDQICNTYLRLNRPRLKGDLGDQDCIDSINVMFHVLLTLSKAMAPFTPFLTEYIYQNLRMALPEEERLDSVHYEAFPESTEEFDDETIRETIVSLRRVIEHARVCRDSSKIGVKFPLSELRVIHRDADLLKRLEKHVYYIKLDLNVENVTFATESEAFVKAALECNARTLGRRLKKEASKVKEEAHGENSTKYAAEYLKNGHVEVLGHKLEGDDVKVVQSYVGDRSVFEPSYDREFVILLNVQLDDRLRNAGLSRDFNSRVQKMRKKGGLDFDDKIVCYYDCNSAAFDGVIEAGREQLLSTVGEIKKGLPPSDLTVTFQSKETIDEHVVTIFIVKID